jgi:putative sterol carrier protein
MEIFSAEWATCCRAMVDGSSAYRAAAAQWEGDLVFRVSDGAAPAAYFDLWHGDCRALRPATAEDLAAARYLFEGTATSWQQVLEGRLVPLMALMTGRLKLSRGRIPDLVPHAESARELLLIMSRIEAVYPE